MVRANDWEGILRYSDAHEPNLPLSVSATNLAAAMTGRLDAIAFNYPQHGPEGLIPPFLKETLSSWNTGEIFFQLGLVNSAQRFYHSQLQQEQPRHPPPRRDSYRPGRLHTGRKIPDVAQQHPVLQELGAA